MDTLVASVSNDLVLGEVETGDWAGDAGQVAIETHLPEYYQVLPGSNVVEHCGRGTPSCAWKSDALCGVSHCPEFQVQWVWTFSQDLTPLP